MNLPTPPEFDGVTWRPATVADAERISALQQAAFEEDGGFRMTAEEFRNELSDPDDDPVEDSLIAVEASGRAVAFVSVQVPGEFESELRISGSDVVHPGRRGRGLEDFLLDWYEARGRARVVAIGSDLPACLRTGAYDWQQERIDRLQARGYRPTRYFVELARDLAEPVDQIPLADGYTIEPWPADSEPIRALHNEAFQDHWGTQPRTADEWQRYHLDEFFRPDLSFIATKREKPVAYLQSTVYPHDFADKGRTEAWVEVLGTARDHRRRGLGSALINRALAGYQADGFEFAAIAVDSESPTGALRLYEALGFTAERRSISFGKELA